MWLRSSVAVSSCAWTQLACCTSKLIPDPVHSMSIVFQVRKLTDSAVREVLSTTLSRLVRSIQIASVAEPMTHLEELQIGRAQIHRDHNSTAAQCERVGVHHGRRATTSTFFCPPLQSLPVSMEHCSVTNTLQGSALHAACAI